jgi:putative exosortase-associated protein (TIGR04073 family)
MICLGSAQSVPAEDKEGQWVNSNNYSPNAVILAVDKLGRGVENVALGVFEIPKQSVKRALDTGNSYGYVSGIFIGIGYFVIRELVGVYEIVTFPFPVPANYEPVMDPLLGYDPKGMLK